MRDSLREGTVSAQLATAGFLARRNLTAQVRRWIASVVGLGVAVMLILFLAGVVRWIRSSTTAYVRHAPAQLVVTQQGVNNLLLSQATVPIAAFDEVAQLPGVVQVTPITTIGGIVGEGATKLPVFVIGHPVEQAGPWRLHSGREARAADEVVLDRGLATSLGIGVGDRVTIIGQRLRVTGLSDGSNAAGIFFVFVPSRTAELIVGGDTASYGLVRLRPGANPSKVAAAIDAQPGIHALTPDALAGNDRRMVDASFGQPIEIFLVIAYVIGLMIAAIVLYTSTIEHARDYAVIKALGGRMRFLVLTAILEAVLLTLGGFAVGWLLAAALGYAFDRFRPVLEAQLPLRLVIETLILVVVVNLFATVAPILHLRRVDPQEVFKA